jgi:hypothetical protein
VLDVGCGPGVALALAAPQPASSPEATARRQLSAERRERLVVFVAR